jgi:hypothetical protein
LTRSTRICGQSDCRVWTKARSAFPFNVSRRWELRGVRVLGVVCRNIRWGNGTDTMLCVMGLPLGEMQGIWLLWAGWELHTTMAYQSYHRRDGNSHVGRGGMEWRGSACTICIWGTHHLAVARSDLTIFIETELYSFRSLRVLRLWCVPVLYDFLCKRSLVNFYLFIFYGASDESEIAPGRWVDLWQGWIIFLCSRYSR